MFFPKYFYTSVVEPMGEDKTSPWSSWWYCCNTTPRGDSTTNILNENQYKLHASKNLKSLREVGATGFFAAFANLISHATLDDYFEWGGMASVYFVVYLLIEHGREIGTINKSQITKVN